MATPGELVRVMAAAFGVPEATVAVHDRNLAIAGLRTKLGRGTSAAKMTARDAANLTAAIMGSAEVRDSVLSIRRYAATCARKSTEEVRGRKSTVPLIPELEALPDTHSFIDALEALYSAMISGSFQRAIEEKLESVPENLRFYSAGALQIEVRAPGASAGIILQGVVMGQVRWNYGLPSVPRPKHLELLSELGLDESSGMRQIRYVMGDSILRVGMALLPKAAETKASPENPLLAECG